MANAPVLELKPSGSPVTAQPWTQDEGLHRAAVDSSRHMQPPHNNAYVDEEDVLSQQDPHGVSTTSWSSYGEGAQSRQAAGPASTSAAHLPPIRAPKGRSKKQQSGLGSGFQAAHQQQGQQLGGQNSTKPSRGAQGSPPRISPSRGSVSSFAPYGQPAPLTVPGAKPKPKARHDLTGVDPAYIETAAYRKKKGVGMVYDWKSQHEQNMRLAKQRKEEQRMEQVLDAARRQIQAREENDEAFQIWLEQKKRDKEVESYGRRRALMLAKLYQQMAREDAYELKMKESAWCGNFGSKGEPSGNLQQNCQPMQASRVGTASGGIRFRLH